jgi:leucine-rich repeat protein SHOC2
MPLPRFIILLFIIGCSNAPRSTITELDLSNQKLTAIPDSVFTLTKLKWLELGNAFTLYPPLSALGSDDNTAGNNLNKISTLPKAIKKLQNLQTLGLQFIDLVSLPNELTRLKKLDTLDLAYNKRLSISAVMPTLGKMTWLKYLDIEATTFQKKDVDSLRQLLPNTKIITGFEPREVLEN